MNWFEASNPTHVLKFIYPASSIPIGAIAAFVELF
jgi:hypothetical protein